MKALIIIVVCIIYLIVGYALIRILEGKGEITTSSVWGVERDTFDYVCWSLFFPIGLTVFLVKRCGERISRYYLNNF